MSLSSSLKLGSLVATIACLGAAASGCADAGDGDAFVVPTETVSTTPVQVAIDTNATVTVSPGQGVGVFVQYASGGKWTITTSCDTSISQVSCGFDLFVSGLDRSTVLSDAQGSNLGDQDSIDTGRDGTLHLSTNTTTNLDGMTFTATPGATIELEVFLDGGQYDAAGNPQSRFVYWIGDGVLHTGAPSNPIDFAPTAS